MTLLDVSPVATTQDLPDGPLPDGEAVGHLSSVHTVGVKPTHLADIGLGGLVVGPRLAPRHPALGLSITDVLSLAAKEQVGRAAAQRLVASMADDHARGYGSVLGLPCEPVDVQKRRAGSHHAVSAGERSGPQPTVAGTVDAVPEAVGRE